MNFNQTQLLTLANNHLTHLFKYNGNDEWFMAEFPYQFDKIEKHWQIDDNHINTKVYSKPMIFITCQITHQNFIVATYYLYFDNSGVLIDEFLII